MLKLAYNSTNTVISDSQGYSIGGYDWGTVDTTDDVSSGELSAGRLILADEDAAKASGNMRAQDAVAHLEERRQRETAARKADKQALAEALPPETVDTLEEGHDGLPSKDDLVDAVVADPNVEIPKTTTSRKSAAKK